MVAGGFRGEKRGKKRRMNIYIETLGCPKNFNDSEMAAGILEKNGYGIVDDWEKSDVIIVNTCGFINDAKKESIETIFNYADRGDRVLVVSGCLSKRYSKELFEEMPEVDIFIGVNEYERLPQILEEHVKGKRESIVGEYSCNDIDFLYRRYEKTSHTAYLKISEGCDNCCAYCVIPSIRGKYRSRWIEDIVKEAKMLTQNGAKEIILIGQDVTAYGKDLYGKYNLHELIKELAQIDGIEWIRLLYCYEDKITDELVETIATCDKVCKYIDIPLQHCADNILTAMRRHSTKESIIDTITRLRRRIPDIAIRTTFITGFPGESEADFDELYDFVAKTRLERMGVFAYSREEGTPAAKMQNQIDEEVKKQRQDALMRLQMEISRSKNESMVGKTLRAIIDDEDGDGVYIGRTEFDAPEIDNTLVIKSKGKHERGEFVTVKIIDSYDYDLVGTEV